MTEQCADEKARRHGGHVLSFRPVSRSWWRRCTAPKSTPRCADTLGPWGKMRLGPVRQILDWCGGPRLWCYDANYRCVIHWPSHGNPCSPEA